jgi:long-subunit acyl-CoA synthetase (AMP-forming)
VLSRYAGDPEATVAAFFTDEATGVRWYRTGDIVEMRSNPVKVTQKLCRSEEAQFHSR